MFRNAAARGAQDGNSLHASAADCKPLDLRFGVRRSPPLLFGTCVAREEILRGERKASGGQAGAPQKTKAAETAALQMVLRTRRPILKASNSGKLHKPGNGL